MKTKIIGILVVTLLIATAVSSYGMTNESQFINEDKLDSYWNFEFVPGEFIVKFKESSISCVSVDNLNEKYRVSSMEKIFKNSENTILDNIYLLKVPDDSDILSIVNDYVMNPNVVYAEPNYIGYRCVVPNDADFENQWALHNTGQTGGTDDADIDAVEAWDIETGDSDIIIAIVDDGIDYTHPDLSDKLWINEDEIPDNGIDDDGNGFIDDVRGWDFGYEDNDPLDEFGHGTFCAGIAGAITDNGIGMAGVCWNCKIMSVCVFKIEGGHFLWWADGIKYAADNGADVISMSFGMSRHTALMKNTIDYAYDKGVILVAGAGNDNTSEKLYPAGYDNVIAVGATNENDENCDEEDWDPGYGTNYGEWVDIAAPGNQIYSTMPTYHVPSNDYFDLNQNYDFWYGTSFSTPQVSGLAALLLSQDPTLTNDEVRRIIRANVDPYISEYYIGTGRINAYKALSRFNTQPENPDTPTGKTSGKPGRKYSFTTSASDSDGDELWYFWDWGDGNYSEWLGPFNSGDTCEASYTWQQEANFSIRVKVKDGKGGESYWSEEFIFSTPKNKEINLDLMFLIFLENHPHLFPLLRQLLELR